MKINIRGARKDSSDNVVPAETARIVNDSGAGFTVFISNNEIQITAKSRDDNNAADSVIVCYDAQGVMKTKPITARV